MSTTVLARIRCLCRSLVGEGDLAQCGDQQLLRRFLDARDERAFAAIVERHGRMVWLVVRGGCVSEADAEDAFQAVFVALFRGGGRIRAGGSLAGWLHTAATRIAKKIRLDAARRRGRERRVARPERVPAAVAETTWDALHGAVHEEIARLPNPMHEAFVLGVLEGRRNQDAARLLGVPAGTFAARICRAKTRLLKALEARGLVGVSAAAVLAGATTAAARVPAGLVVAVERLAASGFAAVSQSVLQLAGALAGGTSMTTKLVSAVMLAGVLLAAGGAWHASAEPQAGTAPSAVALQTVGAEKRDEALPAGAGFRFGDSKRAPVRTVSALTSDGRFAAVGDQRGRVSLWDAHAGKELHVLRKEGSPVLKVGFTPDGKSLIECREDNTMNYWSVPDGKAERTHRYENYAYWLTFSPDGKSYLYGGNAFRLCDAETGKSRWQKAFFRLEAGTFSHDSKTLLWVSGQHLVYLDAATGEKYKSVQLKTSAAPNMGICSVITVSPDGRRLALGMQTGDISFCDPNTGDELMRVHAADRPAETAPERGYLRNMDGVREGFVNRLAFSPDGKWLATGGSEGDVHLWEVATGKELLRLAGHKGWVVDVSFAADGRSILTSSEDGQAYLWSLRPPEIFAKESFDALWSKLAAEPATAYRATWRLWEADGAAAYLGKKLTPARADDRALKWIAELDDENFRIREKAQQALADQGETALPTLRKSLMGNLSAEQRRRIEGLVRTAEALPARTTFTVEELRGDRAITVLEMINSPEARKALKSLATGTPGALRTTAAAAALKRLER